MKPVLLIHGGAGSAIPRSRSERIRGHLRRICDEAYAHLASQSAVEMVVQTVARLEDHPLFNAGTGSVLQRDGVARMSASVMDGSRHRFAGVLNIERVRHPVHVAQLLLEEDDRVLSGAGATRFARQHGLPVWDPVTPARRRQWLRRQPAFRATGYRRGRGAGRRDQDRYDTVSAVALDGIGRLAAATSTGGKGFERIGRVSDSGLPPGNFADARVAVACTGLGEEILEEGLAVRLAQRVHDGLTLARAFALTFRELRERHRRVAAIGVDDQGRWAWAATVPALFAVGRIAARCRVESF